jgi:hypothetical protein
VAAVLVLLVGYETRERVTLSRTQALLDA